MYPYNTFKRIMRASRDCGVSAEDRRAHPGAFTAYLLLACQKAAEGIRAAGYHVDSVEAEDGELVAYVHGTPVAAVGQ